MSETEEKLSRRNLFRWSAVATTAAAAAACTPTMTADAGTDAAAESGDNDAGGAMDAITLNALLSAEYAAIKAYDAGAAILMAPPTGDPLAALAPTLLQIAVRFQSQHREHAAALVTAATGAGGTPIAEASVLFVAPTGFTGTVTNVLKLACNAEKNAAYVYNRTVSGLSTTGRRFLAGNIQGDETQHFIVLYVILKGTAAPGTAIAAMVDQIVPAAFVSTMGTMTGLQSVPDFTYA